MFVHCEKARTDKIFPIFTFALAIVVSTIISVERRWCNALSEDSYSFNYIINSDGILTQHMEERKFGITRGSYKFLQPDGQIRLVDYKVDNNTGFRAVVKYRRISGGVDELMGHLRYPKDFIHPITLAMPVSLITSDLFLPKNNYPYFPK